MKLEFIDLLSGSGGFADIWRARDEIGRLLAVKIIREASVGISNALQHARALARAKHPNVVEIHAIEQVCDPRSGVIVDALVMELLPGVTLGSRLAGKRFTTVEARSIGLGISAAIRHIHTHKITHGDLHEENIMVYLGHAKVIDLLNRYTIGTSNDLLLPPTEN